MATPGRRKSTSISDKLFKEPYRFSFFQATRLLQGIVRKWKKKGQPKPIGYDLAPKEESIRFSSNLSLQFASSEISKIHAHKRIVKTDKQDIAEIQVSFMGLTGQSGVLPTYFTELQLHRLREKDTSFQDFLDIFNHRAVSLFYRAWEKYRLPFTYERTHLENSLLNKAGLKKTRQSDPITKAFESLLGMNDSVIQKQLPINVEELIFYSGLFSTQRRSANALESSLSEYLGVPITINQFIGEWMPLFDDDRCQLPVFPLTGKNNCLGVDTVIGDQVYTMEGKFEIVLGPLNKTEFESIMPGSERMEALNRFTKMFAGEAQHFDVKYKLEEDSVSQWILDEELDGSRRLGWNTWLLPDNKADAQRELPVYFQ